MNPNSDLSQYKIDLKYLISLVRARPMLWDNTLDTYYKHNRKNFLAWREIFQLLRDDFAEMPYSVRQLYGRYVVNQWTTMRDNWFKCHKRIKENKAKNKQVRKCLFYDELSFLSKVAKPITVAPENTLIVTPIIENYMSLNTREKISVENDKEDITVEVDPNELHFVESAENEGDSRAMSFFKGIAPTVDKFTDEEMVDFQYEVLKLLKNIKNRNIKCNCSKTNNNGSGNVKVSLTNGTTKQLPDNLSKSNRPRSKSPDFPGLLDIADSAQKPNKSSRFPFFLSERYTIK